MACRHDDAVPFRLRSLQRHGNPRKVCRGEDLIAVQVLPELEGPQSEVYFVYHEELRHSKRIAVFRDFLIREIEQSLR